MHKIKQHLAQHWLMYLSGLVLITIFLRTIVPKTSRLPQTDSSSILGLQPGTALTEEQKSDLIIVKETNLGGQTLIETRSAFDSKNNQLIVDEEGRIKFVKENLKYDPNHTTSQYFKDLGQPDLTLETPAISDALQAHVWLQRGLVVIAHKLDGTVEQRWTFEPTLEAVFMASWGKEMKTEGELPSPDSLP